MTTQPIAQLFDLSGRSAIVTGGALGIGQAIARRLAEAGAGIVIADVRLEEAERTASEIRSSGGQARAVHADTRRAEDADGTVQAAVEAFGGLDILVNNAGIYPLIPVLETPEEVWDRVIDVNLKGSFLFAQRAARRMAEAGRGGKIINIASIDALRPNGMATHYNASKGGVLMLTRALALELAPHGILVNAVAPGGIATPGTEEIRAETSARMGIPREAMIQGWVQRVPLKRMGEPDDIARVALFLASAAADFITGEMIVVDGGYLLS